MNAHTAAEGSKRAEDTRICFVEEAAPSAEFGNFQASM
jgi:hypothetical protein